jgi:predicted glycosyltransferase involved in capsule biosynthesis
MPLISLLIPFRNTGDRDKQFNWLQKRWKSLGKDFEIIVAEDDGKDPFSKTMAVNNAYKKSTSDILAIMDADVWLDPQILLDAADFIRKNPNSWVRPCRNVYRLKKETTKKIIKLDIDKPFPKINESECERISIAIGGICVFSKKQFESVGGMDPRFRGWGGEDNAWNALLDAKFTKAQMWGKDLYHLWHPRERDQNNNAIWIGQDERNTKIAKEYGSVFKDAILLEKIIKENKIRTKI